MAIVGSGLHSVRGWARIEENLSGAADFAPENKKRQNKSRHPTGHKLLSCFSLASSTAPAGALQTLARKLRCKHPTPKEWPFCGFRTRKRIRNIKSFARSSTLCANTRNGQRRLKQRSSVASLKSSRYMLTLIRSPGFADEARSSPTEWAGPHLARFFLRISMKVGIRKRLTSRDAPTGHKLFNFISLSFHSRRWAHI